MHLLLFLYPLLLCLAIFSLFCLFLFAEGEAYKEGGEKKKGETDLQQNNQVLLSRVKTPWGQFVSSRARQASLIFHMQFLWKKKIFK